MKCKDYINLVVKYHNNNVVLMCISCLYHSIHRRITTASNNFMVTNLNKTHQMHSSHLFVNLYCVSAQFI